MAVLKTFQFRVASVIEDEAKEGRVRLRVIPRGDQTPDTESPEPEGKVSGELWLWLTGDAVTRMGLRHGKRITLQLSDGV